MTLQSVPPVVVKVTGARGENILDVVRRQGLGGAAPNTSDPVATAAYSEYIAGLVGDSVVAAAVAAKDLAEAAAANATGLMKTTADLLAFFGAPGSPAEPSDGTAFLTAGRSVPGDGGGGVFFYDQSDTSTSDNGGNIRVDGHGRRFKLVRPLQLRPEMFGAKGDGETDDTDAIQNALNAAGALGCDLFFGEGIYMANNLDWPVQCHLRGAGRLNTSIRKNANGPLVTLSGTDDSGINIFPRLDDITLDGNSIYQFYHNAPGDGYTGDVLYMPNQPWQGSFRGLGIINGQAKGVHALSAWDNVWFDCWFLSNDIGYYEKGSDSANGNNCNNTKIIGCRFEGNGTAPFQSVNGVGAGTPKNSQIEITSGCKFETNVGGLYLEGFNHLVIGNYLYNATSGPLLKIVGSQCVVVGNSINTPGSSYCIEVNGDGNIISGNQLETTSTTPFIHVAGGDHNKIGSNVYQADSSSSPPTAPSFLMIDGGTNTQLNDTSKFTFTPQIKIGDSTSGITYANQNGEGEVRNGICTISMGILLSSKGSGSGNVTMVLPVQAQSEPPYIDGGGIVHSFGNMSGLTGVLTSEVSAGTNILNINQPGSGGISPVVASNLEDNTFLTLSLSYKVAPGSAPFGNLA